MRFDKWPPRFWAVYDDDDELICVTVYKKGAKEVIRRLTSTTEAKPSRENAKPSRHAQ
jgi:hypothetical protein